jgi:hypothetical protein
MLLVYEGWDSSYLSFTMATTMAISQGEFPLENEDLKRVMVVCVSRSG